MPPEISYQLRLAGFLSRFLAFWIDLVIISLVSFLVTVGIGLIFNFFGLSAAISNLPIAIRSTANTIHETITLAVPLLSVMFGFIYILFFWTLVGFTPGKALLGLRIVRNDGQHLTLGRAILRLACYWISALPLFGGFIWILFDDHRQSWHDKIARTYVVYIGEEKSHKP